MLKWKVMTFSVHAILTFIIPITDTGFYNVWKLGRNVVFLFYLKKVFFHIHAYTIPLWKDGVESECREEVKCSSVLQGDLVRELREKGAPEQEVSKAAAELKSRKKTLEAKVRVSQLLIGLCTDSAFSLTCFSSRASLLSFITPTLIKK